MGFERFSGIPGRRARAAVLDVFSSRFIFIPLFILFAAACLVITGCTDEEVAAPQERDDWADGTSPSFVKSSPHDKSPPYVKIWEPILGHGMFVGTDYWPLPAVLVLPG
ncbi:MAG: hypothetical protein KAU49_06385, partial [Candidatus Krumholzibacteria bacterium]|nr:hypothetical protein [Candidatus Krumholzibacteria bacterium]